MRLKLRKRSSDCEADSPDLSYMQWILSQVSANGWAVPGVLGGGGALPWAYSIGLWATFGHPDLAAFGRPLNTYYDFSKADVVLALDADFLACGPGSNHYVHDFAARRRVRTKSQPAQEQIVQAGTTAAVFRHPASPEVARILGVENVARGVVAAGGLVVADRVIPIAHAAAATVRSNPGWPIETQAHDQNIW